MRHKLGTETNEERLFVVLSDVRERSYNAAEGMVVGARGSHCYMLFFNDTPVSELTGENSGRNSPMDYKTES